jgi:uncharacterized membrane protein
LRRSISAATLALALVTGMLSALSPVAGAATSARSSATPKALGQFGARILDVPVSAVDNPRALAYIIDFLPAGTVIHRRILVANEEPRKARFSVYPDAAYISGGQFTGYPGATRSELTTWIKVQHPTVTLAAGKSVPDLITIKVPRGATRGEHYGVIWVQQASQARNHHGIGVLEVARVGIRVYLAVGRGGTPPTSFDITSITGHRTAAGQPVIVAHVNNTGGRAIDLSGTVRLADGPANTSAGPFRVQRIVTLAPGQSWNVTFVLPASLPFGSWRATVTLVSGMTSARAAATVLLAPVVAQAFVSGMQLIWLALIAFAGVLAAFMGRYAWRQRRRQATV